MICRTQSLFLALLFDCLLVLRDHAAPVRVDASTRHGLPLEQRPRAQTNFGKVWRQQGRVRCTHAHFQTDALHLKPNKRGESGLGKRVCGVSKT